MHDYTPALSEPLFREGLRGRGCQGLKVDTVLFLVIGLCFAAILDLGPFILAEYVPKLHVQMLPTRLAYHADAPGKLVEAAFKIPQIYHNDLEETAFGKRCGVHVSCATCTRWLWLLGLLFSRPFFLPLRGLCNRFRAACFKSRISIGSPLLRAPEHGECIYLDYQATTPVWPEVAMAAGPYLRYHWGNPSSEHAFGRPCATAVASARANVASLISACEEEILFVASGSEADNHAIVGVLEAEEARRQSIGIHSKPLGGQNARALPLPHVVTSNIEHPAITACLENLQAAGRLAVTYVQCDSEGRVTASDVAVAVTNQTILVSIMHSNNEVGSVQPVREIAAAVRKRRPSVIVHTDAAQSIGKVDVDVDALDVDLLTIVGHKFGAPKGVAALYIRRGINLPKFLHGGGQEAGRRAGTECVVLLAALGEAAKIAVAEAVPLRQHMRKMRDLLTTLLVQGLPDGSTRINGPRDDARRLPNTLSIGLKGVKSSVLLERLSEQVAASAGAACHSNSDSISCVLKAMEVPLEFAFGTLRLSTGRHTTESEVRSAANLIITEVKRQWGEAN